MLFKIKALWQKAIYQKENNNELQEPVFNPPGRPLHHACTVILNLQWLPPQRSKSLHILGTLTRLLFLEQICLRLKCLRQA